MLRVRACRQFLIPFTPLGLYEVDIVSQKEMKAQKLVESLWDLYQDLLSPSLTTQLIGHYPFP